MATLAEPETLNGFWSSFDYKDWKSAPAGFEDRIRRLSASFIERVGVPVSGAAWYSDDDEDRPGKWAEVIFDCEGRRVGLNVEHGERFSIDLTTTRSNKNTANVQQAADWLAGRIDL